MAAPVGATSMTWHEELATLVGDTGIRYSTGDPIDNNHHLNPNGELHGVKTDGYFGYEEEKRAEEPWMDQIKGFAESTAEMMRELGRGCWDIARQSVQGAEESEFVKKMRGPLSEAAEKLSFLNEYLPEDKEPAQAWPVVISVFLIALLVLNIGSTSNEAPTVEAPRKMYIAPPSATRIQLPDGRHIAYLQQGVPPELARFNMIMPHSFLSSRLAGIPGMSPTLLEEFGVQLVTYDLPGFGESDPHPERNLNTSALDMLHLANSLRISEKFWVVGYSGGAIHAWAAARYIPDNLAGVAMFAPMVNPYDLSMNKEERRKTWEKWSAGRKFMYTLARKFPSLLSFYYRRSFLSGTQGQLEKWLYLSLTKKDKLLLEEPVFMEFWEKDVAESVRQGDAKPFIEESVIQVSDWGFTLSDIQVQKQKDGSGFISLLKSLFSPAEKEWTGFLGPIHVWQGMDDTVVPPSMTEFVRRVVPGATVHTLHGEGHFSYFCFCDKCHRQIFSTLFGIPQGPLTIEQEIAETTAELTEETAIPEEMTTEATAIENSTEQE
ncbi:hypothetical protein LUZ61_003197 [Rhynchospora tenuis]|uniref:AB hydrolase-1 domain-containing protein n=1 Tax=Rhynchospora tenuis TaxID=198213 RepID=A0AAD6ESG3_9POAL|nr:hypothetical protein LUZ61_003197 [Rhynchospora tenuis]